MTVALYTVAAPTVEPVGIDLVRAHLRLDTVDDDELLAAYVTAARELVEAWLDRALITQTLCMVQARQLPRGQWPLIPLGAPLLVFPQWVPSYTLSNGALNLLRSPIQQVTGVAIGSWGQEDTALVLDTDYAVDTASTPGRVHFLGGGGGWGWSEDHVSITYVAGYGDGGTSVPGPIKIAILWTVAFLYENRGDAGGDLPLAIQRLLAPYRLMSFG